MAYIYQASVLKEIANEVGLAEKNLQDQLNVSLAGSGLSYLKISRDRIAASIGDTTISSSDFDASTVLGQVFRTKETGLTTTLNPVYSSIISGLNTYFSSVTTKTMRNYFDCKTPTTTLDFVSAGTAYSTGLEAFRKLYARTVSEELIYAAYTLTSGGAAASIAPTAYGWSSDFTNSSMELRIANAVGTATTFTVSGVLSTGVPTSISVTVGSGTSTSNIGTTQKFSSITVVGVPASIGTTTLQIWTR
jgi:hypothetical protein